MTGNTKIWRAPLAGLASVAMIATMGMAAATANAATSNANGLPTVTLKTDGKYLADNTTDTTTDTVQIQDDDRNGILADELNSVSVANPVKVNNVDWVFTGWYEPGSHTAWDPTQQITDDVTLEAHYAQADDYVYVELPTSAKTTFAGDFYNGTVYGSQYTGFNLAYDDVVAPWQVSLTDKSADHYVATGFTYDNKAVDLAGKSGSELADLIASRPSADANYKTLNLTAAPAETEQNAYTVTFDAPTGWKYNGDSSPVSVDVIKGQTVDPILATGSNGYSTLTYNNAATNTAFDFAAAVTGDVTLIPQATGAKQYYTVKYAPSYSQSRNAVADTEKLEYVVSGEAAKDTAAPAPAKAGYEFVGWSVANDPLTTLTKDVKLADLSKITADVTVYPVYAPESVTVTWYNGYGVANSVYTTQKYADGAKFAAPADPTREGYKFADWTPAVSTEGQYVYTTLGGGLKYYKDHATGNSGQAGAAQDVTLSYTATWTKSATIKDLQKLEDRVPEGYMKDANGYKHGDDKSQTYFTAASFDQYVDDWQQYNKDKAAMGSLSNAEIEELYKELKGYQDKLVEVGNKALYRAYNLNDGDHYFTIDRGEYDGLVKIGWSAEGKRFDVVESRTADADTPANLGDMVYTVWNPNTGEHLLTTSKAEVDFLVSVGWLNHTNPETAYYTAQNGETDVYRAYNPNASGSAHLYTDASEANGLAARGWSNEGVKLLFG